MKKTPSGVFLVKVIAQAKVQPITIVPPNPGTQADTNLSIGAGNEYCSSSAGGVVNPNHDRVFKLKNAPAPVGCNVTACSPSGAFLDGPTP